MEEEENLIKEKKMRRTIFSILFALVLVLSFGLVTAVPVSATPDTLVVDQTYGPYYTIQSAINDASPGDTIIVHRGTYAEALTIGTANLTLQSKWGAVIRPTTYPGWGKGAITILADGVTVDGFEIDGTTVYDTGILGWETSGLTIKNNKIHGFVHAWHGCGILLFSWGNSGTVYDNLIEGNEVYDTGRMGIMICDYDGANYTVTSGNIITGNTVYDVWKMATAWDDHGGGIQINVAKDCSITNNEVYNVQDGQRGIYMYGSAAGNTIEHNTLRDNPIGIQLWISGEGGGSIAWEGETATSPQVHCNNIYDNSEGAISTNKAGTPMVMDATRNWWGHISGPSGVGPGSGDAVSDDVDYDPWLQASSPPCVAVTPPVASFSAQQSAGQAPLTVKFRDRSTGTITSWRWDFGDSGSTRQNPSHTYQSEGIYTVRLTITGPKGTSTAYEKIIVESVAMPPKLLVRNVQITPDYPQPRQAIMITADVANVGGTWGSGTISLMINGQFEQSIRVGVSPGTAKPISFNVYKVEPGRYNIDIEGANGTFDVMEQPPAPPPAQPAREELGTGTLIAIVVIGFALIVGIVVAILLTRRA